MSSVNLLRSTFTVSFSLVATWFIAMFELQLRKPWRVEGDIRVISSVGLLKECGVRQA